MLALNCRCRKIRFEPGLLLLGLLILAAGGCAGDRDLERINREQAATIHSLNQELKRVNGELEEVMASRSDFEKARAKKKVTES